ncbi:MAG: alpha/beta hydrolase [Niabella sp.]
MYRFPALWLLVICSLVSTAQTDTMQYKKVEFPEGYTSQLNVVYTKVANWEGRVDLYLPPKANGPSPVVVNIHGGGWNKGSKESQTGFSTFFKKGYAVANMAYRLSQQATAPAAVEDVRGVIIYLINHAKELNIDVNKIVLMGGSAGGHLAMVAGFTGSDKKFDNNCQTSKPVHIAAIIDKYGVADVGEWKSKSALQWLGDKAGDATFIQSVSPLYLVNRNVPPVFIVHGDADPTVPYQQSVDLKKKLDAAGVKNRFITIPGGLHGKFSKEENSMVNKEIISFLKELNIHQ